MPIKRQERRLIDHHRDEAEEGEEIAPERIDQEVEHLRRRSGPERDPRSEFGGVAIGIEGDVLRQELVEQLLLVLGDDVVRDARERDGLAVARQSLDGEDDDHRHRDDGDSVEALFNIGLVDAATEQECREGGAGGPDRHEGERQTIAPPISAAVFEQQPADQRRRALRIGKQTAVQVFEHPGPTREEAPPRPCSTALADHGHVVHAGGLAPDWHVIDWSRPSSR